MDPKNVVHKQKYTDYIEKQPFMVIFLYSKTSMTQFTLDNLNSFLSPDKILSIAQENKYLGKFSYFIMELYVVCTH